ncbi:MAG TPA: glycerol-3-phosphate 1-O-acyltransferase PlsY [Rickettsiales bacterium]|nr:glycerol-3-phosphate 1-O-acyltransferase PlsY [Rickettsiales bacterium]
MDITTKFLLFELFAYLCGSIPFGLIISKLAKNIDIREHGSHNIGSTNVARTLGKKWGALVLLLDGLKATIPLLIAKYIFNYCETFMAVITCTIIIGHIFTIWLKFKGGKGVACLLFSLFVLDYRMGLVFLLSWILLFFLFRISALSALSAIIITLIFSLFISKVYFIMMIFLSLIIFFKHIENIKRLLKGEEFGFNNKK